MSDASHHGMAHAGTAVVDGLPIDHCEWPPADLSSDDSSNSEVEDRELLLDTLEAENSAGQRRRRRRRRRRWEPAKERYAQVAGPGERAVLEEILRREHYAEQFIGDRGDSDNQSPDRRIRLATANVNGGTLRRMRDEICPWALANNLDFIAISDAGMPEPGSRTVWARDHSTGTAPAFILISATRAAIIIRHDRWASRWKQDATRCSPSGRSISITVRMGKRSDLVLVASYCPTNPTEHAEATLAEHTWLSDQVSRARASGRLVMVAGDFNNYGDEAHDREGPPRSARLRRASSEFAEWTDALQLRSTFRTRHANLQRYTYENGGTRSALDDIYISAHHAHAISSSGIWLYALNVGDHVGTPFVEVVVDYVIPRHLTHVKDIKVLKAKGRTRAELDEFGRAVNDQLDAGHVSLGTAPPTDLGDRDAVTAWLDTSIRLLYSTMYSTAKSLWGERSQAQRSINAAVSKKRSARCDGQFKAARRAWTLSCVTAQDVKRLIDKIQWPKWIIFPASVPASSPHAEGAAKVHEWRRSACPDTLETAREWAEEGFQRWKAVLRMRRDWRVRQRTAIRQRRRRDWMQTGGTRQVLRDIFGAPTPPVTIRGAMVQTPDGAEYHETRTAVTSTLSDLLDAWVPAEEKTTAPAHATSLSTEDEESLPQFVKEWLLEDIKRGGTRQAAFSDPFRGWQAFQYDKSRQQAVDRAVSKGVAPGHGGIHQELWVAAPECIRAREREVFAVIIQTGIVPAILNHRQMVFLPKTPTASGVWSGDALPPWRPITMQSSLATRLFTALSSFLEDRVPNNSYQHGFQRDRTVQDASVATTLLLDRARRRREPLYVLSKDCEKCYDRIPRWVMLYIYLRLGTPPRLVDILMAFLAAGQIDVRTAYGWISCGMREFGLGQGSALSIRHIGYFMDVLIERQRRGPGQIQPQHNQLHPAPPIATIVLVDDVVDVATTRAAIEDRAGVSNKFTGRAGTGGVFGAAKSFLLHVRHGTARQEHPLFLADGLNRPRAVRQVSPDEGFKHLGVLQSSRDVWSGTLKPVWQRLKEDAARIIKAKPSLRELQYIVNQIWLPRLVYRTQLSSVLRKASHIDKLVRRVARHVLRLPMATPPELFHDREHGIGLANFEDMCMSSRLQLATRILNTPHVPAYHLLVEALEDYQRLAGLTSHPLHDPLPPPSHLQGWVIDTIRAAASLGVSTHIDWVEPSECVSTRPGDRCLWRELSLSGRKHLLQFNVVNAFKIRFVGDIANSAGTHILSTEALASAHRWPRTTIAHFRKIEPNLREALCSVDGRRLATPVGRTRHDAGHLRMAPVPVAPGGFFITAQFEFNEEGTDIQLRYHELGERVGHEVYENEHGLGREISVRWWHERSHGSGVWTVRPEGNGEEFVDVIVPVTVTPAGPPSNPMRRVLVWNGTAHGRFRGTANRSIIDEAFARSRARVREVVRTGRVTEEDRSCTACNRFHGTERCASCARWHHAECLDCAAPPTPPVLSTWALSAGSPPTTLGTSAGDGSVINSGKPTVSGTWAHTSPFSGATGRLQVHWRDITSTRCECYALIAGLIASGDTGEQVCDNRAAIRLLAVARDIAEGRRPTHIRQGSKHRVEVRTMVRHMRPGGSFAAVWVKSHEESMVTTDTLLAARRAVLAEADARAAAAHDNPELRPSGSILAWDWATLVDADGRPVVGDVMTFLATQARDGRRRRWIRNQQLRPDTHHTITEQSLATAQVLRWTDLQQRFYWRSIGNVLHTNARKHTMYPMWAPTCRLCRQDTVDSQAHRFAADLTACTYTRRLADAIGHGIHRLCYSQWLPDQEIYLPRLGHDLAAAARTQTRSWWRQTSEGWCPLFEATEGVWIHACQPQFVSPDMAYACGLLYADFTLTHESLGGRLLPARLQRPIQSSAPDAAAADYHPIQLCGIWTQGRLHPRYPRGRGPLALVPPRQDVTRWWVDDIYRPRSTAWWHQFLTQYRESRDDRKLIWAACYADSAGFQALSTAQCTWYVCVPAGAIRMRTAAAVVQSQSATRSTMVTKNPRAIWIGVVAACTYDEHAAYHDMLHAWINSLQHEYSAGWLLPEHPHVGQRGAGDLHELATWSPATRAWFPQSAHDASRLWLHSTFPSIYAAPAGWRAWPSLSSDLREWSCAISISPTAGSRLLHGIISTIWNANADHWRSSCEANHAAIITSGEADLLADANAVITRGVRAHSHLRLGLDTSIDAHVARREQRTASWHETRTGRHVHAYTND